MNGLSLMFTVIGIIFLSKGLIGYINTVNESEILKKHLGAPAVKFIIGLEGKKMNILYCIIHWFLVRGMSLLGYVESNGEDKDKWYFIKRESK